MCKLIIHEKVSCALFYFSKSCKVVENNKKISKLNFSIDAPVELFIIDMLWMLIVKKLYLQKYGEFEYSYAGKLKKGIMKKDTDIINGIDFVSNRCFEPYFQ